MQGNVAVLPGNDSVTTTFGSIHRASITSAAGFAYSGFAYRTFQLDSLERITRWSDSVALGRYYSRDLAYDSLGRLKQTVFGNQSSCTWSADFGQTCTTANDSTHAFTYDLVGNRTDHSASYSGTSNRISAFDGCSYTLDNDGNVTVRVCGLSRDSLWWSAENRLDSATNAGTKRRYRYDAFGRLVRLNESPADPNPGPNFLIWDGDHVYAEVDSAGGDRVAEYSWYPGTDRLHAIRVNPAGTPYWAHQDAMGNVILLTDTLKNVIVHYVWGEWGKLEQGGVGLSGKDRARFKGALELNRNQGFYYMRNRWYEPHTGRFLSADPIGLAGGVNPYVFAGDDPINRRDPRGTVCYWIVRYEMDWRTGTIVPHSVEWTLLGCREEDDLEERYILLGRRRTRPREHVTPSCKGFLDWPVPSQFITSEFGPRDNPPGFHQGVDIRASYGTDVRTAAPGVVSNVGVGTGSAGLRIWIDHPGGFQTRYLELSGRTVERGQAVRRGQVIASSGTGALGPMLHFELWGGDPPMTPTNPRGCLP